MTRRRVIKTTGVAGVAGLAGCSGDGGGDGGDGGGGDGDGGGGGDGGDGGDGTTVGNQGDDVTTIEYWRWPHSTEPSNTGEDEIVQAFNDGPGAEQGIRVEQVTNPFGDHGQAVRTAIGSNDAPDVAWTFTRQYFDPVGNDRATIEEEAPYTYIDNYVGDDILDQFYQPYMDLQEALFGGIVGLPFISGLDPGLLYLNVEAWEAAGLGDLPEGNWSWEAYLDAAEQIDGTEVNGTEINGVGVGLSDAVSNTEWNQYLTAMSRTAGSLVGDGYQNTDGQTVLTLASDPEVEGWNALIGTPIENGWTNNPGAFEFLEMQDQFVEGQVALVHNPTFSRVEFAEDADFEFAIIPYPTKNGEENFGVFAPGTGAAFVLFTTFKEEVGANPEAAAEFIKFRNNARNQYNWFNTSSQVIPNREAFQLMEDEGVSEFIEETRGFEVQKRVNQAMEDFSAIQNALTDRYPDIATNAAGSPVTSTPRDIASGRVHETIGGALQRLGQSGNSDPQARLTEAEEQWAQFIQQADNVTLAESSAGYNRPEPQAGPLN
jgi:ABC-type glycerol-3-phosphate transport system substrate-binding protein